MSTAVTVEMINVPANTGVGAVTVAVTYDAAKVTVASCGPATDNRFDSVVCNTNVAGTVRIALLSTAGVAGNAGLARLELQSQGHAGTVVPLVVTVSTFVDQNANPIAVSKQDGAVIFRCRIGDVNCDGAVNPTDALFMVQYEHTQRPPSDTIPLPRGFLYLAACDLNGDQRCDREDARLILQCAIGVVNPLCQGGG